MSRITHPREADVVQDQPLPVHAGCYGRMIFLLKDVSQDDEPNIFMGQACLQQRNVLRDRIVLAIAAMALRRLVHHASSRFIAGGRDAQIDGPVDQAGMTRRCGLASDLQPIASAVLVCAQQRRRGPALAKTASRCTVMRRLPNPDLVQPGSAHPDAWRSLKTERRPHAQVSRGVSDAGPRCAMQREY
jgi:hypothetical protein